MKTCFRPFGLLLITICMAAASGPGVAQEQTPPSESNDVPASFLPGQSTEGVVDYPAEFFNRYQPNTALDIVNRVPGFTIDDGGDKRGFGGAAGNVLINDRRPSTKQDAPSAILSRISADQVETVELIRVRIRDIDLQGRPEVLNVVLHDDAPASIRWEIYGRYNFEQGMSPFAGISYSDRWRDVEYNVGFDTRNSRFGDPGTIRRFDGNDVLTEIRSDDDHASGPDFNLYANASTWLGKNFVQLNTKLNSESRDIFLDSTRVPQVPDGEIRYENIKSLRRNKRLEIGIDGERLLSVDLLAKAIVLYSLLDQEPSSSQTDLNASGEQTRFQLEDEDVIRSEFIARLEFDWAGFTKHAIRMDMERAFNVLDNEQIFTDDTGGGPVVIDVPGGNVRVEEVRWNFLVQDTWLLGKFSLNYGLGFERSTISQTGDANLERSFDFAKPRAILTYSPQRGRQTQLRLEREVSQLNFEDFVTATVFEDDDVALGNPDLHPDSTWIAELTHERRFGDVAVVKLTTFHHWIEDVLDLLPLTPTFEAPGNIGDGRRWGLILETTLPVFESVLDNAQWGIKARWQNSTVVDPVTGVDRRLSGEGGFRTDVTLLGENQYAIIVDIRQDLEAQKVSWGLDLGWRDERVLYKANELDIFDEGYELGGFIETTRWFGIKIGLEGENLLNTVAVRDRTIYVAERALTPVLRRELRDGTKGARIFLRFSGTF